MRHIFRSAPARLAVLGFGVFFTLSLVSRILLLIAAHRDVNWGIPLAGSFACGLFFDAAAGLFAALPWLLLGVIAPVGFLAGKAGRLTLATLMTVFAGIFIFITTSEWFFWDEFGARFNFIAVDYLIWTQEVLGNISESYPIGWIVAGIALAGGLVSRAMWRKGLFRWVSSGKTGWQDRLGTLAAGLALAMLAARFVSQPSMPAFANQYNGELAKNGCWSFFAAFRQMELEFGKWYRTLPDDEAVATTRHQLVTPHEAATSDAPQDLRRSIRATGKENQWNVIVVCMESMSGEYMSYVKGRDQLTPNLDRLASRSVFFENLYATGTRTVRGMEALTLNLPPTPGMAIIYRPEGTHLTTTFTPFLQRGYDCAFFYGGDGRFDYMNRYFGTAGCRIMDVNAWDKKDVTFKTAWGACDEDLFNKTLSEADQADAAGRPFHYFCMTTSNHRPFDFPAGRIDLAPHNRKAAVKYADWAIGDLINKAATRPWFDHTLFVICADHCASSAGKEDLNVTKFRIPAMIYAPSLVPARKIGTLCSQIDVMPTLFGLLNWSYDTYSYGYDRLAPGADKLPARAFVSNYQKIALIRDGRLAILKPKREASLYDCDLKSGKLAPLQEDAAPELLRDTTSLYQSASWLFGSGRLKNPAWHPQPTL